MFPKQIALALLLLCLSLSVFSQSDYGQAAGFLPNVGQVRDQLGQPNPDVLYLLPLGNGLNVQLRSSGFSYDAYRQQADGSLSFHRIDVDFEGGNPAVSVIPDKQQGGVSHFPGAEATSFGRVLYRDVFPLVDVEFVVPTSGNVPFEYNFILRPGANPSDVQLRYTGAPLCVGGQTLDFTLAQGVLTEAMPRSFLAETQQDLAVRYQVLSQDAESTLLGFDAPAFEAGLTLVIDPIPTLDWATYLGGGQNDSARDMTIDAAGNLYMVGSTSSVNNIATTGAHQSTLNATNDALLAKFDGDGNRLWSTYFGGEADDFGQGVALDTFGNVFITGLTFSTIGLATLGVGQPINNGAGDGFMAKFDADGVLLWATYMGGSDFDFANDIATDLAGNAYSIGWSMSAAAAGTLGVHQPTYGGGVQDAFVASYDANGARRWWTFLGGDAFDTGLQLARMPSGDLVASGWSSSTANIATTGAYQTSYAGGTADAFLARLNTNGTMDWVTYYGGTAEDYADALHVAANGDIFMGGPCTSSNALATAGTHQPTLAGGSEAFLSKFDGNGQRQWGTYFGGSGDDAAYAISTDAVGRVYLAGYTRSTSGVATPLAQQTVFGGGDWDAYVARFSTDGLLDWATYHGGANADLAFGLAVDDENAVFIAGKSTSTTGVTTMNSHQATYGGGGEDAFLAKFLPCVPPTLDIPNGGYLCADSPIVFEMYFTGGAPYTITWTVDGVIQAPVEAMSDTLYFIYDGPLQDSIIITSVSSGECVGTFTGVMNFLKIVRPLDSTPPSIVCDAATETYTVSVEMSGGFGNYIPVGPTTGFVNDSLFTSVPLPFGQDYDVQISAGLRCDTLFFAGASGCVLPCDPLDVLIGTNSPVCEGATFRTFVPSNFTYNWAGPDGFASTLPSISINNMTPANAGNYRVTVTDADGCTAVLDIPVAVVPVPTITNTSAALCEGEPIVVQATGGTGALNYGFAAQGSFQPSSNLGVQTPGNYAVIVQDVNFCADTLQFTVQPQPDIASVAADGTSCGLLNGTINVAGTGGTAPLTYSIDGGTTFGAANISQFVGLPAGNYSIQIRDANGCTSALSQALLSPSQAPVIDPTNLQFCTNEAILVSATGGTPPLQYALGAGPLQASNNLGTPTAGTYPVRVQDANGCETTATVTVTPTPIITAIVILDSLNCDDQQGDLMVLATGSPGIQFSLDNVNFSTNATFANLPAGAYTFFVRDGNGCSNSLAYNFTAPDVVVVTGEQVTPTTCGEDNGSIAIQASGGSGALQYSLNAGLPQTSSTFSELAAGNYSVLIRDEANCTVLRTIVIASSTSIAIADAVVAVQPCSNLDGSIAVQTTGGTGIATYRLNNGPAQAGNIFEKLTGGTYLVAAFDAAGCSDTLTVVVPDVDVPVVVRASSTPASCQGSNGAIEVVASGGTGALSYAVNGGAGQPLGLFEELASGAYTVVVRDEAGCTAQSTVAIAAAPCDVYVPNAISPNFDGVNDALGIFPPAGMEGEVVLYQVFDRWGGQVFVSKNFPLDSNTGWWNGKYRDELSQAGIYLYQIQIRLTDGQEINLKGDVLVVR